MINSNKWFYHQEQKSTPNERFVIKCFIIVCYWCAILLADAEIDVKISNRLYTYGRLTRTPL